ncbi:hypothetical protein [Bradyrhizobium sp. CCBAU 51753]|uniref:hypothetical protein n=1 Tax=Bradyrhizobium sp. CCBAU 51753 TaxID=1325100 RepID=UPI00188D3203|nr:hypothetical protein [Bradyrhizobium sp. CCBAU 51753]QOZ26795.1 hypothetical protein XH93_26670 [Bradyrhizobium sp. CCBAU 51753]
MRGREVTWNMLLLGAFTLLSLAGAGLVAALDSAPAPASAASRPAAADLPPVRIVGTPFIPNTNPRRR